jgi:hypothetical protein
VSFILVLIRTYRRYRRLYVFIPLHPAELLPHVEFVPFLSETRDLPVLDLEQCSRRPARVLSRGLDPVVGLALVRALGGVAERDEPALGVDEVERDDVQVVERGHHRRVRVGIVERRVALRERRRRGERRIGCDEVLDGRAALVLCGRVRDPHVLLHNIDVFLYADVRGCPVWRRCPTLTCSSLLCCVWTFTDG